MAARAIEFYKQAFGATERGVNKGPDGKVMHAELVIGDSIIMLGQNDFRNLDLIVAAVHWRHRHGTAHLY